jgi:hypothetical protein
VLARGFGTLLGGVAFVAGVVELLARDGVCGDQLLHAMKRNFGVDGIGLGGGKVGLGLRDFLHARAILGLLGGGVLRPG